jgi:hypothetical protein
MKSEFNKKELKDINRYIDKMYKKFLKPIQLEKIIKVSMLWLMEGY